MSIDQVNGTIAGHSPLAQRRRGQKIPVEVSVRCGCGRYQSPWRASMRAVAQMYADHVVDATTTEGATS